MKVGEEVAVSMTFDPPQALLEHDLGVFGQENPILEVAESLMHPGSGAGVAVLNE